MKPHISPNDSLVYWSILCDSIRSIVSPPTIEWYSRSPKNFTFPMLCSTFLGVSPSLALLCIRPLFNFGVCVPKLLNSWSWQTNCSPHSHRWDGGPFTNEGMAKRPQLVDRALCMHLVAHLLARPNMDKAILHNWAITCSRCFSETCNVEEEGLSILKELNEHSCSNYSTCKHGKTEWD